MARRAVEAVVSLAKGEVIRRMQAARLPLRLLFRSEGGEDLFKARIALLQRFGQRPDLMRPSAN